MKRLMPLAGMFLATCGLAGCGHGGRVRFDWRQVSIAGRTACWPIASSEAAQERGLMGVRPVRYPMVFPYSQPTSPTYWMKDTPAALTGVWVGASGRVIGYWHGQPFSETGHEPPSPISAVIEFPAGAPVPPLGTAVHLGAACPAGLGL
jgi:uncharacterized membrane protein (UPF0127 family)